MENDKGFVYIMTNPSFRDDWIKIGITTDLSRRLKDLNTTGVPLPFEVYASLQTAKYKEVEKFMHHTIDRLSDLRINRSREFFSIDPSVALDILKEVAVLLDDAVLDFAGLSNEHLDSVREESRRSRSFFKLDMVGISPGDILVFVPTGVEVRVVDGSNVEYEDRLYRLSTFTKSFLPDELRNASDSYRGSAFFTYNGRLVSDLFDELISEE